MVFKDRRDVGICLLAVVAACSIVAAQARSLPHAPKDFVVADYKGIRQYLDDSGLTNIFLTWTTGPETLDALAVACITSVIDVYSPLRQRASGGVYILANHLDQRVAEAHGWVRPGVHLVRYEVGDVLQETPVESWYLDQWGQLEAGKFWFSHVTDLMRFALVYKHGGVYMDADVLLMRPISASHVNKVYRSLGDSKLFECAVVFFEAGSPYLFEVLKHIPRHYRADDWCSAGPRPLTAVYERLSRPGGLHAAHEAPRQVLPSVYLGIRLKQARKFWKDGVLNHDDFIGCEAVHLWGSVARGYLSQATTYIKGKDKEREFRDRVHALKRVSWCKPRAPRLDKCADAADCEEQLVTLREEAALQQEDEEAEEEEAEEAEAEAEAEEEEEEAAEEEAEADEEEEGGEGKGGEDGWGEGDGRDNDGANAYEAGGDE